MLKTLIVEIKAVTKTLTHGTSKKTATINGRRFYTVSQKKQETKLLAITSLTSDFQNFFTSQLGRKFATNSCLNIPPRFKHVATLHTRLTALFPGIPRWVGTRKVKPIWILLKQETVSGSGISWAICKSAPRSRHRSVFHRPHALPATQPTASKHWRHMSLHYLVKYECRKWHHSEIRIAINDESRGSIAKNFRCDELLSAGERMNF